jgi:tRNA(fMet)-specific endonuclease VapC
MAIVLDSDVIIEAERGGFDLGKWLSSSPDEQFVIAAVTVAEIWHGLERATGAHRARRQQFLEDIVHTLPVLPYTERTAYEHARIWAELERAGQMTGAYDLIVAATAIEHGCGVATFNKRHFSPIAGLKVIDPRSPVH